ncbi:putative membrane protein YesL [Streptohalobacillus salinus]|uniref:Putative membrane protein YesL n=1 Tax=Streptohalobacillus salinus TaxID=621096 RepID=A0A2V3W9A6_9BACI|nr:DUF624 domain-containing protein [Streptohalobacillus salinus]PXW90957.1 putative membrane protein YesL [Streptohalobacillus salinus]
MQTEGFFVKLYFWLDQFMKIAYVNLLWLVFSLIGLGVFGVLPAFVAVLTIIRKWMMKDTDVPIFQTFLAAFKQAFIKANLSGLIFAFIYFILSVNYQYMMTLSGALQVVMAAAFGMNAILFFVTLVYFYPVYVHYDLRLWGYFKQAFLFGLIHIHYVLVIGILIYGLYHLFVVIPAIILMFSPILLGLILMPITLLSFKKIEKKKQNIAETNT